MKVSPSSLAQPFLFHTWYLTPSVQGSFLRDSSDTSRSQTFQDPWKKRGKDYLFSETNLKGTIIATTYWEPSRPVIHILSPMLSTLFQNRYYLYFTGDEKRHWKLNHLLHVTQLISVKVGIKVKICSISKPLVFLHIMVLTVNLQDLNPRESSSQNYAPKSPRAWSRSCLKDKQVSGMDLLILNSHPTAL